MPRIIRGKCCTNASVASPPEILNHEVKLGSWNLQFLPTSRADCGPLFMKHYPRDFLGGSGVGTLDSQSGDIGSIPGQGIKIPDVAWCGQEDKKEPLFWKRQRSRKRWIMSVG